MGGTFPVLEPATVQESPVRRAPVRRPTIFSNYDILKSILDGLNYTSIINFRDSYPSLRDEIDRVLEVYYRKMRVLNLDSLGLTFEQLLTTIDLRDTPVSIIAENIGSNPYYEQLKKYTYREILQKLEEHENNLPRDKFDYLVYMVNMVLAMYKSLIIASGKLGGVDETLPLHDFLAQISDRTTGLGGAPLPLYTIIQMKTGTFFR